MAKEIKTEIIIHATPDKIWKILTDFENYPSWNPFITSINGKLELGNNINVCIEPPEGKKMNFSPTITTIIDNKQLSWLGRLFLPGIFDGTHTFAISNNGNGTVTFTQSEVFSGILIGLLNKEKTQNGFIEMNKKLKERAEKI